MNSSIYYSSKIFFTSLKRNGSQMVQILQNVNVSFPLKDQLGVILGAKSHSVGPTVSFII